MAKEQLTAPKTQENLKIWIMDNLPLVIVAVFSLILFILVYLRGGPPQIFNILVTGAMWALLATGLALVFGVMNIPHFAHGESFMIGAFVGYFVFNPLNQYLYDNPNSLLQVVAPILAILAAGVVGALMGILIEKMIFAPLRHRTKKGWVMNAFLLTVGISFVLTNGTNLVLGPNFRGIPRFYDVDALQLWGAYIAVDRIMAAGIAIVTISLLWFFLQRTKTGRAIRAVSQDETGAQLVGIDLDFIQTLTFSLATAMAAISGASLLFMFQAYPTVGVTPLYFSWYVVMLAGLGNVAGAIVGGFIVALLQSSTQMFIGLSWQSVVPTVVMILVLVIAPSGIFGSEVKGVQEQ
ncbi:MAG: branched-chain amino acid ABC transporter permease [Anaerolineales bacterium]|nr:branched-chain amino acid ABC transporter permease [Anaerolineales bacterium]